MTRASILVGWALAILGGAALGAVAARGVADRPGDPAAIGRRVAPDEGRDARPGALPRGVPERVAKVLAYVDEHDRAMPGYEGGRTFLNLERHLPQADRQGRRVRYREWDVHPLRAGVNRGAERLVTGSDGSAYYTRDHYRTFVKIR